MNNTNTKTPHRTSDLELIRRVDAIEWTIVADPVIENPPSEYANVGLVGFDWTMFSEEQIRTDQDGTPPPYNFPFLTLFKVLWPGDYREQIQNMNKWISDENKRLKASNGKTIRDVNEQEFWKFIGILIFAGAVKKKGCQLWEPEKKKYRRASARIDLGPKGMNVMPFYRFKKLRAAWSYAFDSGTGPEVDPYHMVRLLIDGFNRNRQRTINSSVETVFDESMTAWRPRTSKTGKLPNISFVQRKPEPLGVEYKVSKLQLDDQVLMFFRSHVDLV